MNILQRLDNGRQQTHLRIVDEIVNPVYSHAAEVIQEPRPAWWEDEQRHRRWMLERMMPGGIECVDGFLVMRKRTAPKWFVEGEEYKIDEAVQVMAKVLAEKRTIKPFYKIVPLQKRILRYWKEYEDANGDVPLMAEASRKLGMSTQLISKYISAMGEWDIAYQADGHYGENITHWHFHWDKLVLVDLTEE